MTLPGYLLTVVCGYLLFNLPRRWAALPMLIAANYMTASQQLDLGGLHFTVIRIMALVGLMRVMIKGERFSGGFQTIDRFVAAWGAWMICSSIFHENVGSTLIFRCGFIFDNVVVYFLFRVFMRNPDEFLQLCRTLIIVLVPLATLLLLEKLSGHNWFSVLGGVSAEAMVRDGKIRAQGPFGHPILAGTAGAACLPTALLLWPSHKKVAIAGVAAALLAVYASASSGPIMTVATIMFGLALWMVRTYLRQIRWAAVGCVVALALMMKAPVWYLLARIDLAGGSTGWHRAELINTAINHLGEWWLTGTDYTRHWIAYGVPWSKNHIDITNHYIQMGVFGGLPLMLLFMGVLAAGFAAVGEALRRNEEAPVQQRLMIWTLGAILFGHAVTFLSVSYFDQTVTYLYFLLAAIGSLHVVNPVAIGASATVPDGKGSESPR
jgi:hypothetical protein